MSIPAAEQPGNTSIPWTDEVRRQAFRAVRIAVMRNACDRTLGYFLRLALAHGLTVDEVLAAGVAPETLTRLTDPAVN
jgi:pyrroloquinoline quinone (PQQ) biosynthesis protein C